MADSFYPDYIGFVGTASVAGSKGIYKIGLDVSTGKIRVLDVQPMYNPGYLTLSRDKKNLYVVSEGMTFQGYASGGITAYDVRDGHFEKMNSAVTGGQRPCFVCCDDAEKEIYVSNFFNGTLAVYEKRENGRLGKRLAYRTHPKAENGDPKLHCVVKSPTGRYAVSLELVGSRIFVYDSENSYEIIWEEKMPEGSGPRHLTISEDGRFIYVNHQRDSKVSVFSFTPDTARKMTLLQRVSVRSDDMVGRTEPAAIHLSSNGRILAVSNRGMGRQHREDSIAMFRVDQETGLLDLSYIEKTRGEMPRDFNFTPDGRFLVVGYQFQNYLDVYEVTDRGLNFVESSEPVPSPVCIAF